jgi:hypothetical protein
LTAPLPKITSCRSTSICGAARPAPSAARMVSTMSRTRACSVGVEGLHRPRYAQQAGVAHLQDLADGHAKSAAINRRHPRR